MKNDAKDVNCASTSARRTCSRYRRGSIKKDTTRLHFEIRASAMAAPSAP